MELGDKRQVQFTRRQTVNNNNRKRQIEDEDEQQPVNPFQSARAKSKRRKTEPIKIVQLEEEFKQEKETIRENEEKERKKEEKKVSRMKTRVKSTPGPAGSLLLQQNTSDTLSAKKPITRTRSNTKLTISAKAKDDIDLPTPTSKTQFSANIGSFVDPGIIQKAAEQVKNNSPLLVRTISEKRPECQETPKITASEKKEPSVSLPRTRMDRKSQEPPQANNVKSKLQKIREFISKSLALMYNIYLFFKNMHPLIRKAFMISLSGVILALLISEALRPPYYCSRSSFSDPKDKCVPCPAHSICASGRIESCDSYYKLSRRVCRHDSAAARLRDRMISRGEALLNWRAGDAYCSGTSSEEAKCMRVEELQRMLAEEFPSASVQVLTDALEGIAGSSSVVVVGGEGVLCSLVAWQSVGCVLRRSIYVLVVLVCALYWLYRRRLVRQAVDRVLRQLQQADEGVGVGWGVLLQGVRRDLQDEVRARVTSTAGVCVRRVHSGGGLQTDTVFHKPRL